MDELFMFVWEGVFSDYTPGLAFAVATDKERAIDLIIEDKYGVGQPPIQPYATQDRQELIETEPDIYSMEQLKDVVYSVTGGG